MAIIGEPVKFEGAVKPDSISVDSYEPDLFAARVTEIPNNMTKRVDYGERTDSQPIYVGWACKGLAETSDGWLVYKTEFDVSNRIISIKIGYGTWTGRTEITYD